MNDEKGIAERIGQYQEIAKTDKNVDVGALAIFELQAKQAEERVNAKKRRWAYVLSVSLPPVGLLFAAYYVFSGKSDGKKTAAICVILTAVTMALGWLLLRQLSSGIDATQMEQIKNINLDDYRSLLE